MKPSGVFTLLARVSAVGISAMKIEEVMIQIASHLTNQTHLLSLSCAAILRIIDCDQPLSKPPPTINPIVPSSSTPGTISIGSCKAILNIRALIKYMAQQIKNQYFAPLKQSCKEKIG